LLLLLESSVGRSAFPQTKEQYDQNRETEQLAQNAITLMTSLPSHAHLRLPLLSILCQSLPPERAASLFNISPSYVRSALRSAESTPNSDLYSKYPTGTKRNRISEQEEKATVEWIKAMCPALSGSQSEIYHQYQSNQHLYDLYTNAFEHILSDVVAAVAVASPSELTARDQHIESNIRSLSLKRSNAAKLQFFQRVLQQYEKQPQSADANSSDSTPVLLLVHCSDWSSLLSHVISFLQPPLHPRSLKTFNKLKSALRLRHANAYWGWHTCLVRIPIPIPSHNFFLPIP
jgi:hypothetical protein